MRGVVLRRGMGGNNINIILMHAILKEKKKEGKKKKH